jgi:hypothetical protein
MSIQLLDSTLKRFLQNGGASHLFSVILSLWETTNHPKMVEDSTKTKEDKMRKDSRFTKDIKKALKAEMIRIGHESNAVDYVVSRYDFDTYLLEGTLSHITKEISAVENAVN